MMDVSALAAVATTAVAKSLAQAARGVLDKTADAVGDRVGKWIKARVNVAGTKEALADLEVSPADGDVRRALESALTMALKEDGSLAKELHELLGDLATGARTQKMVQTGDGNRGVQIQGNSNKVGE
jgi:hypothetical protein